MNWKKNTPLYLQVTAKPWSHNPYLCMAICKKVAHPTLGLASVALARF